MFMLGTVYHLSPFANGEHVLHLNIFTHGFQNNTFLAKLLRKQIFFVPAHDKFLVRSGLGGPQKWPKVALYVSLFLKICVKT